jgi:bifunctional non-homologous end joining protein LigD
MDVSVFASYTPMAPTQVREPFHRDGWVYEEKVDGWRIVAYKDGDRVRLVSRSGRDHIHRLHQIAAAVSKLRSRSLVLDGEVAIYDQQLRSRFEWLREPDPDAIATPPMFMVFDLLHRDGRELTGRPLREWRARLEDIVTDNDLLLSVAAPRPERLRGVGGGDRARLRGLCRQGRDEPIRGGADAAVVVPGRASSNLRLLLGHPVAPGRTA